MPANCTVFPVFSGSMNEIVICSRIFLFQKLIFQKKFYFNIWRVVKFLFRNHMPCVFFQFYIRPNEKTIVQKILCFTSFVSKPDIYIVFSSTILKMANIRKASEEITALHSPIHSRVSLFVICFFVVSLMTILMAILFALPLHLFESFQFAKLVSL